MCVTPRRFFGGQPVEDGNRGQAAGTKAEKEAGCGRREVSMVSSRTAKLLQFYAKIQSASFPGSFQAGSFQAGSFQAGSFQVRAFRSGLSGQVRALHQQLHG
jgi:hypothetical protein